MGGLERPFAVQIARIIHNAAKDAADAVETYGASANIDGALSELKPKLGSAFIAQYERTTKLFGNRILTAFKSHAGYEKKADDLFAEELEIWIRTTAAQRVVQVEETTRRLIRKALDDGLAEQMTGAQVANHIVEKTGGVIAKSRGITIARTETHMAANKASKVAAESTGIPMKRVWIAAADERTREDHSATDSQSHAEPVGMNEMFSPVNLDFPGDPGGPPEQTVNCRCAVGYVPA